MHWIVTKRDSFLFFMMCRGTRKPTPIVFFFLYLLCVFSIQLHFRPASAFLQTQKCRASSFFFSSFSGLIFHLRIKRSHNFFFLCGLNASSLLLYSLRSVLVKYSPFRWYRKMVGRIYYALFTIMLFPGQLHVCLCLCLCVHARACVMRTCTLGWYKQFAEWQKRKSERESQIWEIVKYYWCSIITLLLNRPYLICMCFFSVWPPTIACGSVCCVIHSPLHTLLSKFICGDYIFFFVCLMWSLVLCVQCYRLKRWFWVRVRYACNWIE